MFKTAVAFRRAMFLVPFMVFCLVSHAFAEDYPDWFLDDSFKDFPDDLENAITDGKKGLMVVFVTEGCSYCKMLLTESLANPRIARLVQRNFDVVGLEIFDDVDMTHPNGSETTVKAFAVNEGAVMAPTLLFYGPDGNRFLKLVGYQKPDHFENIISFIEQRKPSEDFNSYLERKAIEPAHKSSYRLKQDPLFLPPPYHLQPKGTAQAKPLLVIFETDECVECSNFHRDVMVHDEIRGKLEGFDVVRLDSSDDATVITTPSGDKTTPRQWYSSGGFLQFPALMFFSDKGQLILQTDSLVRRGRMLNSLGLMLDKAYEQGWTYQRYARSKGIERAMKKRQLKN